MLRSSHALFSQAQQHYRRAARLLDRLVMANGETAAAVAGEEMRQGVAARRRWHAHALTRLELLCHLNVLFPFVEQTLKTATQRQEQLGAWEAVQDVVQVFRSVECQALQQLLQHYELHKYAFTRHGLLQAAQLATPAREPVPAERLPSAQSTPEKLQPHSAQSPAAGPAEQSGLQHGLNISEAKFDVFQLSALPKLLAQLLEDFLTAVRAVCQKNRPEDMGGDKGLVEQVLYVGQQVALFPVARDALTQACMAVSALSDDPRVLSLLATAYEQKLESSGGGQPRSFSAQQDSLLLAEQRQTDSKGKLQGGGLGGRTQGQGSEQSEDALAKTYRPLWRRYAQAMHELQTGVEREMAAFAAQEAAGDGEGDRGEGLATCMQSLQRKFSAGVAALCRSMARDAVALLGPPPCAFSLIATGSLGRGECLPCSDLDVALLLGDHSLLQARPSQLSSLRAQKYYFDCFMHLFNFKVGSLDSELHLDELCVTYVTKGHPFGINTPRGMAQAIFGQLSAVAPSVEAFATMLPLELFSCAGLTYVLHEPGAESGLCAQLTNEIRAYLTGPDAPLPPATDQVQSAQDNLSVTTIHQPTTKQTGAAGFSVSVPPQLKSVQSAVSSTVQSTVSSTVSLLAQKRASLLDASRSYSAQSVPEASAAEEATSAVSVSSRPQDETRVRAKAVACKFFRLHMKNLRQLKTRSCTAPALVLKNGILQALTVWVQDLALFHSLPLRSTAELVRQLVQLRALHPRFALHLLAAHAWTQWLRLTLFRAHGRPMPACPNPNFVPPHEEKEKEGNDAQDRQDNQLAATWVQHGLTANEGAQVARTLRAISTFLLAPMEAVTKEMMHQAKVKLAAAGEDAEDVAAVYHSLFRVGFDPLAQHQHDVVLTEEALRNAPASPLPEFQQTQAKQLRQLSARRRALLAFSAWAMSAPALLFPASLLSSKTTTTSTTTTTTQQQQKTQQTSQAAGSTAQEILEWQRSYLSNLPDNQDLRSNYLSALEFHALRHARRLASTMANTIPDTSSAQSKTSSSTSFTSSPTTSSSRAAAGDRYERQVRHLLQELARWPSPSGARHHCAQTTRAWHNTLHNALTVPVRHALQEGAGVVQVAYSSVMMTQQQAQHKAGLAVVRRALVQSGQDRDAETGLSGLALQAYRALQERQQRHASPAPEHRTAARSTWSRKEARTNSSRAQEWLGAALWTSRSEENEAGGGEVACYVEYMPEAPCLQLAHDALTRQITGHAMPRTLLRVAAFRDLVPLGLPAPALLSPPLASLSDKPEWPPLPQKAAQMPERKAQWLRRSGRWLSDFLEQQELLHTSGLATEQELAAREASLLDAREFTLKFLETLVLAPCDESPAVLALHPLPDYLDQDPPAHPQDISAKETAQPQQLGWRFLRCRLERVISREGMARPPFVSSRRHGNRRVQKLHLRSVLLCCSHMPLPLHPGAVEEFLSLDVAKLVETWLAQLQAENAALREPQALAADEAQNSSVSELNLGELASPSPTGPGQHDHQQQQQQEQQQELEELDADLPRALFTQREVKRLVRFLQEESPSGESKQGVPAALPYSPPSASSQQLAADASGVVPPPPPLDTHYLCHAFARRDVARLFRRLHLLRSLLLDLCSSPSAAPARQQATTTHAHSSRQALSAAPSATAGANKLEHMSHLTFLQAAFPALHQFYESYCWRGPAARLPTLSKFRRLPTGWAEPAAGYMHSDPIGLVAGDEAADEQAERDMLVDSPMSPDYPASPGFHSNNSPVRVFRARSGGSNSAARTLFPQRAKQHEFVPVSRLFFDVERVQRKLHKRYPVTYPTPFAPAVYELVVNTTPFARLATMSATQSSSQLEAMARLLPEVVGAIPLRRLDLSHANSLVTPALLNTLSKVSAQSLLVLDLTNCRALTAASVNALALCKQLEVLNLSLCAGLEQLHKTGTLLASKALAMPALQKLYLEQCTALTSIRLSAPRLELLAARDCLRLERVAVSSKTGLEVDLRGCHSINQAVLEELALSCDKLLLVDLSASRGALVTLQVAAKWPLQGLLLNQCSSLQSLEVMCPSLLHLGLQDLGQPGLAVSLECPQLVELDCSGSRPLLADRPMLQRWLRGCPRLERWKVTGDAMLEVALQRFPPHLALFSRPDDSLRRAAQLVLAGGERLQVHEEVGPDGIVAGHGADATDPTSAGRLSVRAEEVWLALAGVLRQRVGLVKALQIDFRHNTAEEARPHRERQVELHSAEAADVVLASWGAPRALGSVLRLTPQLTALCLCGQEIGDAGLTRMISALEALPFLTSLRLDKQRVGDAAVVSSLVPALHSLPRLTALSLAHNQISSAGVKALSAALAGRVSDSAAGAGAEGRASLGTTAHGPLQLLRLEGNPLSRDGLLCLAHQLDEGKAVPADTWLGLAFISLSLQRESRFRAAAAAPLLNRSNSLFRKFAGSSPQKAGQGAVRLPAPAGYEAVVQSECQDCFQMVADSRRDLHRKVCRPAAAASGGFNSHRSPAFSALQDLPYHTIDGIPLIKYLGVADGGGSVFQEPAMLTAVRSYLDALDKAVERQFG
eukprot:g47266.t1